MNAQHTGHRAAKCEGIQLAKRETRRTAEEENKGNDTPVREEPKSGKSESGGEGGTGEEERGG